MISEKLVIKHAPRGVGEQIHINHEGCEAGEDTKKRLYIKRTNKGIVSFCHNCQEGGFVKDHHTKGDRLSDAFGEGLRISHLPIPRNISKDIIDVVSPSGRMWLHTYGIDTMEVAINKYFKGVRYNQEQIALRIADPEDNIIGWQIRNLDGKPPKYITRLFNLEKGNSSWFHTKNNKNLVICEDFLSAYTIFRDTKGRYSTVALLKTSLSDKCLEQIVSIDFPYIVIWLDPDKAGREGTAKLYKKLQYFLPETTKILPIITHTKEPKECTQEEIERILSSITTS